MNNRIFSFDNLITEFKSEEINSLTSNNLSELKEQILSTIKNRKQLKSVINNIETELFDNRRKLKRRLLFPFGKKLFKTKIEFLNEQIKKYELDLAEKKEELKNSIIEIHSPSSENIQSSFKTLVNCFRALSQSEFIWDITTSQLIDRVKARSYASNSIDRKRVNIFFSKVDMIKIEEDALHFQNANGGDIYIYPTLIIIVNSNKEFALLDYKDVQLEYRNSQFVEEEKFPSDSKQIGTTWAKVNKDGSRDRRFSNNYQIPIALYGQLSWRSSKGFNEVYQFSNSDEAEKFQKAFLEYKYCYKPT
ncbi:MAG: hypothetical protein HYZ10_12295 [Ignavibacteriales bacterium]|nr:hypothetical protein [Ignavibacteriales bacterium]